MTRLLAIGECMIELSPGAAGDQWQLGFAGDTVNTVWYARAGLDPKTDCVGYFTALGRDSMSDRIMGFLNHAGIGTQSIRRIEGKNPGLYLIEQKDGDRAFMYWRGDSAARRMADDAGALAAAMQNADMIYLRGITLAILDSAGRDRLCDALQAARTAGKSIAYDPNIRPALWQGADEMRSTLMRVAGLANIVLPSFEDEARVFGDATPAATVARYRAAGAAEIVVKDGGAPVTLHDGSQIAVPQCAVVDATAAGDSFNGGYLAARLKGASPAQAARAGIEISAQVIQARGAILHLPGLDLWAGPS
ncbi:sugar kinase [Pseudorhodobacter sp.]|uniref:sugar kinase n=1 Tax=Pseudorhodobacter sp. TaxID=1934400 RepID=UPI002649F719|nr:sugar kinase [Pseudorhodobacter sp.]MDN5785750.1 sugar kinase [Pseudorhodobacter sp.]